MIRRFALTAATLVATAAIPLLVGCGGSTKNGSSPADSGASDGSTTGDAGGKDSSKGEGGGDDGGLPEGAVAPHGTQLVTSQSVVLNGVTSDGYAVYTDSAGASPTLNAVAISGGSPKAIGANDGSGVAAVVGAVAIVLNGVSQSTGAGALSIWTNAHGAQTLSSAALAAFPGQGNLDVSADGAHILFLDNTTATSADVTVVDADGTNKKVLVAAVSLVNQSCPPFIAFAGSYAVVAYCAGAPADAGAADAGAGDGGAPPTATIATYTGSGWATKGTISSAAFSGFAHDTAGAQILYVSGAGLQVGTLASGASKTIDATGNNGVFTSTGQSVVYTTTAGSIMLASASGAGTPTTLQTGYPGLLGLSPDDKWLVAYKAQTTTQTDVLSDLYLSSATTGGTTAVALSSTQTAALFGDAFTADSSHVMFANNVSMGAGDFDTAAVTGGNPKTQGSQMWINSSTTGAKAVFNVNYNAGSGNSGGAADLESIDTSSSAAPTLLVTQADAYYYLTAAKDKVVYSWSYLPNSMAGIWVLPLP